MGADKFVVDADAFRFYEDDGSPSESASTAIAAQDTNITRDVSSDNQVHLRYRVQEVGAGAIAGDTTDDYTLQYQVNGSGGFTTITAATSRVQADPNSQLTDRGATTDRSTDGISAGSGSFFAGEQEEGGGEITDFQHEADNYTEHVWALNLVSADWSPADFVEFRMRINGGAMDNSVTPRITTASHILDNDAFRFYEDDGTESSSTPLAAQDTNITGINVDSDFNFHLRFRVQETGGVTGSEEYTIRVTLNGGSSESVEDISLEVRPHPGSGLTDAAATTNRAAPDDITDGTGSFVAGSQEDTSTGALKVESFELTANDFTEHVFGMTLQSAGLNDGDFLEFKINAPADITTITEPRITVVKAAGAVIQDIIMGPGIIPFER